MILFEWLFKKIVLIKFNFDSGYSMKDLLKAIEI